MADINEIATNNSETTMADFLPEEVQGTGEEEVNALESTEELNIDENVEGSEESNENPEESTEETVSLTKAEYDKLMTDNANIKKSYDNLRPSYTKATQEVSKLKKLIEGTDTQKTSEQKTNERLSPQDVIANIVKEQLETQLRPLQEELSVQKTETAITQQLMKLSNNDIESYNAVAPKMFEMLEAEPSLWGLGDERAIDVAYKMAENMILKEELRTASTESDNEDKLTRELKRQSNTQVPKKPSRGNKAQTVEEEILNDIMGAASNGLGSAFR